MAQSFEGISIAPLSNNILKPLVYMTWVTQMKMWIFGAYWHIELMELAWVECIMGLKLCVFLHKTSHSFTYILRMNENATLWNLNSIHPFKTRFSIYFCLLSHLFVSLQCRFSFGLHGSNIKNHLRGNISAQHHKMNTSVHRLPFFPFSCIMDVKPVRRWCVSWFYMEKL